MATPKKIILLACGSFNPPTHMHLRIFEIARDYLHRMGKYQVVAGLMSPVHDSYGKKDLASSSDRCEMVRRSLQNSDWIHLSDWECHQTGWTPTRQVLHQHQELVDSIVNGNLDSSTKRQRTEELAWARDLGSEQLHMKLLCGGDLLESFGKPGLWKDDDIETIVGSYGLVVITREGSNPLRFIYESDVLTRLQRNIDLVTEWIANEVSSSRIRRALGRCESVKYLLPDPVITYVHQRGLYGASSEYVRPLSLLLVPGMPPSFLTPSPCDVDMTYCERPVLTLTAPDASSTTAAGDLSPPACRTAPSPPRPTPQPRQESGRCRTWRRGVEKKPGSSRRVRPEPAAKVSCGDSGSEGDTDRGSETPSPPPQQQQQVEASDGPGCQPSDTDQGDGYRSDRDGGLSMVAGSDQEGEVGRDGHPLPPESDTSGRQNGDSGPPERDVMERRGSWEDDLKDRPPPEPPCGDTPAGRGDCDPQSVPDTDTGPPGSPPAPVVDTTARSPPPVIGVNGADRGQTDRIDNHRPPPSSPERRDTPDHDRPSESTAGISTGQAGDEVDQDGTPPPPEPPPPVPGSSPAQVYCGRYGDRPQLPSITVTEHGDCGGTDGDDPPSPEPPGPDGADPPSPEPPGPDGADPPSPEPPEPDAADGDRIRIELRQDGVTVVSGRETQL